MKLGLFTLVVLAGFLQISNASPLRFQKRAAFYIANETACVVDNIVYFNGEPIPTDDPCEACKCRPPGFACVLKECEVKPGCRAVRRAGHCCPEYICGCEHNGRMYRDGDEIKDSQNPCFVCHCQGTSIACSFVDCFFRVDCAPEYVSGECCPHYNNCIPISSENQFGHNVPSSSEQPFTLTTLMAISTEQSTSSEKISTESSKMPLDEESKEETDSLETLATSEETKTDETVEKSEETYSTQKAENDPSSVADDVTHLDKDIAVEEPINSISLNSGMDLSVEESKEDSKEEITTIKAEENPEVLALNTAKPEVVEDVTSEGKETKTELMEVAKDTTEKLVVTPTVQAMDETIDPQDKRKSMKFHENVESSTDFTTKENTKLIEPVTKDLNQEQASTTEVSVEEEVTFRGTKIPFFNADLSTKNGEENTESPIENTEKYEEKDNDAKEPMIKDEEKKELKDELAAIDEMTTNPENNKETVTLVIPTKDKVDQLSEKEDQPTKENHPEKEAEKKVEQPSQDSDKNVEKEDQPDNNVTVGSSTQANQESRYKALDAAILSAFDPINSPSTGTSVEEKKESSEEVSEIIKSDDDSQSTEIMGTTLTSLQNESTKLPEIEEMTSINVKSNMEGKPTEDTTPLMGRNDGNVEIF